MKGFNLRSIRIWGVLGLVLALVVVVVHGQAPIVPKFRKTTVTISGTVCRLVIDLTAVMPIRCEPVERVSITLINAATGRPVGIPSPAFSDADGNFTIFEVPQGIHVYAVLEKSGFKKTATFLTHVTGDITGIRLPIVDNATYNNLIMIAAVMCNVRQDPAKSIIFTLFHPKGRLPDGTPGSLYRGAAVDADKMYTSWPTQVSPTAPGDRRWLGFRDGVPACVSDYKVPGFTPITSIIFNAERNRHPLGEAVKAYRMGRVDLGSLVLADCLGGIIPGVAPTPADITVGIVRCRPFPID